jgi:hypothetical protein
MAGPRTAYRGAVSVLVIVSLLSGPVGVGLDLTPGDDVSLGDGDASITVLAPEGDDLAVTAGRFGAEVAYLRIPDLAIRVDSVEGSPRVVYRVLVPELATVTETRVLTSADTGRLRVDATDRAIPYGDVTESAYQGQLEVRVQSFTTDRTVINRTMSVEVAT